MSYYDRCKICGKFDLIEKHKCAPEWWACGDPTGDDYDALIVYAGTASDAAEVYAKRHDAKHNDYREYQDVYVRRIDGDQTLYKVDVQMEMEPTYSTFGEPVEYVAPVEDSEA
jgi:hypothetical protein